MDSEEKIDASLDILKRMPPQETEKHLKNLTKLLQPDSNAIEDLHHKVDCPLQTALDTTVNKPFVLSEYNRAEGESYRSPWSNEYFPSPSSFKNNNDSSNNKNVEGIFFKPSGELRELEEQANEVLESYREMYYGKDSVGSVYLWNQGGGIQEGGFAGCFLIQKQICKEEEEQNQAGPPKSSLKGYWNSIHVVDVNVLSGGDRVKYELSTTALVSMDLIYSDGGNHSNKNGAKEEKNFVPMVVEIGGSMSKHKETICTNPTSTTRGKLEHIANIGQMMEAVEIEIRSNIDTLSIQQTKDVLQGIRKDSMASSWAGRGGSNVMGGSRSSSGVGMASLLRSTASQNPMQAELMARLKQRSTCQDSSHPNK